MDTQFVAMLSPTAGVIRLTPDAVKAAEQRGWIKLEDIAAKQGSKFVSIG